MTFLADFRTDIERYRRYSIRRGPLHSLWLIWRHQGLWALLQFRIASAVYHSSLPRLVRSVLLKGLAVWQQWNEVVVGICIPPSARIGPGLHIAHFGNIFIHHDAVIGSWCNIHQGVSIGISGKGKASGVPVIGDRVYIGPHAVVLGNISVGADAVISPSSLVIFDVPPHTTVLGVPARVVSKDGSEEYIRAGATR